MVLLSDVAPKILPQAPEPPHASPEEIPNNKPHTHFPSHMRTMLSHVAELIHVPELKLKDLCYFYTVL